MGSLRAGICSSKPAPTLGTAGENTWGEKTWINPCWCLEDCKEAALHPKFLLEKIWSMEDLPAHGTRWALGSFPNQTSLGFWDSPKPNFAAATAPAKQPLTQQLFHLFCPNQLEILVSSPEPDVKDVCHTADFSLGTLARTSRFL